MATGSVEVVCRGVFQKNPAENICRGVVFGARKQGRIGIAFGRCSDSPERNGILAKQLAVVADSEEELEEYLSRYEPDNNDVTDNCQRCRLTDSVAVCRVGCFRGDDLMPYIDPVLRIDCGVCVGKCPAEAIGEDPIPASMQHWVAINAARPPGLPSITRKQPPFPGAEARRKSLGFQVDSDLRAIRPRLPSLCRKLMR